MKNASVWSGVSRLERPVLDLFDLEFNLEYDLVGQNDFHFRDQQPSIDLIRLG